MAWPGLAGEGKGGNCPLVFALLQDLCLNKQAYLSAQALCIFQPSNLQELLHISQDSFFPSFQMTDKPGQLGLRAFIDSCDRKVQG